MGLTVLGMVAAIAAPPHEVARASAPIQSHARFCEVMTRKLPNVTPTLCALRTCAPARPARCKATIC
jgi:hypothetical protein